MDYRKKSLKLHNQVKGKIEIISRVSTDTDEALALAYTPGVAQPCLEIQNDTQKSFELTRRWNSVAVITDGSAVLGLGDIGPEAGMPVMEGKAVLFKNFGDVDAFPLCIKTKDADEFVRCVSLISGSYGGINLEDISAPRCFEIERKLQEVCDIPVFHDDQHGTAIVVCAALMNALKITNKKLEEIKVVQNGPGAAGSAIIKMLKSLGVRNIIAVDEYGILIPNRPAGLAGHKNELANITNPMHMTGTLAEAIVEADVFIGTSVAGCLTKEMVKTMHKNAIIFACANPVPEIYPDEAKEAGAAVVCTGRSDFPNQLNNVLIFPGFFRGMLDAGATKVTDNMKIAAVYALAGLLTSDELKEDYILPKPFDKRVKKVVADAVKEAAIKDGAIRTRR